MKHALAIAALGLVTATLSANADAQIVIVPGWSLGTAVPITCKNPGSSQDVVKTPYLVNSTTATMKKGQSVSWATSDGERGTHTLAADLPPGGQIKLQGSKPGNAYTCNASFFSKADLTVAKAAWASPSAIAVSFTNKDPWVGAGSSVARVEIVSCSGSVLKSMEQTTPAFGPGETKTLSISATMPAGKHYLRVIADNGKVISESNESNNVWDAINSCVY